jgi:hypothetical protein
VLLEQQGLLVLLVQLGLPDLLEYKEPQDQELLEQPGLALLELQVLQDRLDRLDLQVL